MEETLIYNVITWVGLAIVFFYQKNKIEALKTTVDAQKNFLESAKSLSDLFKVEDYEGYIKLHKEKNEMEAEKLIEQTKKEFLKKLNTISELNSMIIDDFAVTIYSLLLRIPPDRREEEILKNKTFNNNNSENLLKYILQRAGNNYYPLVSKNPSFGEIMYSLAMTKQQDINSSKDK